MSPGRLLLALLAFATIWAGLDYLAFARRVQAMEPPTSLPDNPAIVVLTGGSGLRIARGLDLLGDPPRGRLLISGADPNVTREELARRINAPALAMSCCVDVGYTAGTTIENASETATWVQHRSATTVVLVTSNYHLPRALIELRRQSPEVEFIPYPVTSLIKPGEWHRDPRSFRGMVTEWAKFRITTIWRGRSE